MTCITMLLPCHCSNEHNIQCNMAVVRIDRDLLAQIKQRLVVAIVSHAQDADLVDSYFWADVDFVNIDGDGLAEIKKSAKLVVEDFIILDGKPKVALPEKTRADCVQMRVGVDGHVRWMAYDHYCSDEFSTESVSLSDLNDLLHPSRKHKKGGV